MAPAAPARATLGSNAPAALADLLQQLLAQTEVEGPPDGALTPSRECLIVQQEPHVPRPIRARSLSRLDCCCHAQ